MSDIFWNVILTIFNSQNTVIYIIIVLLLNILFIFVDIDDNIKSGIKTFIVVVLLIEGFFRKRYELKQIQDKKLKKTLWFNTPFKGSLIK
jgi:hypothetical protein